MGGHTRRWVLGAGAGVITGSGLAAWWLTADTPDAWDQSIPFLTDASVFYNKWDAKKKDPAFWITAVTRPDVNVVDWRGDGEPFTMRIDGDAARGSVTVTREDVLRSAATRGSVALLKTMRCSGDRPGIRLASNAVWTGVPLRRFLDPQVTRAAKRLRIRAPDGFSAGLSLDALDTEDGRTVLLAFQLNGEFIPHARGGPVRLIVPDRFGFKNVKWPRHIEITSDDVPFGNHEVDTRAGTDDGHVTMGSKLLSPDLGATNPVAVTSLRPLVLRGVAFGGREAVEKVQVRFGGGDQPWRKAQIPRPKELELHHEVQRAWRDRGRLWPLPDVWTPWLYRWTPPGPGDYTVSVKATTESGAAQPEVDTTHIDALSHWATGTIRVTS